MLNDIIENIKIDKNYYQHLPKIKNATIVIHDPTELKPEVLEVLKRFKVITIDVTISRFYISKTKTQML